MQRIFRAVAPSTQCAALLRERATGVVRGV